MAKVYTYKCTSMGETFLTLPTKSKRLYYGQKFETELEITGKALRFVELIDVKDDAVEVKETVATTTKVEDKLVSAAVAETPAPEAEVAETPAPEAEVAETPAPTKKKK